MPEFIHQLPERRLVEKLTSPHSAFHMEFGVPEFFCLRGLQTPLPPLIPQALGDVDFWWTPLARVWKAGAKEDTKLFWERHRYPTYEYIQQTEWVWPPPLDLMVGFEFKTHPVDRTGKVRRIKNQQDPARSGEAQAERLAQLGFDYAWLIDVLPGEPVSEPGQSAWLSGAELAAGGAEYFAGHLARRNQQPFGRAIAAWSMIGWKDAEQAGGFGIQLPFVAAPRNPLLGTNTVANARVELVKSLTSVLDRFVCTEIPFPAYLLHCNACKAFHLSSDPTKRHCADDV
jgi:hypothetical protein